MAKFIVIASNQDEVVIVTPRSRDAARGILGSTIAITPQMVDHPATLDLLEEVGPAFAAYPAAWVDFDRLRAEIRSCQVGQDGPGDE